VEFVEFSGVMHLREKERTQMDPLNLQKMQNLPLYPHISASGAAAFMFGVNSQGEPSRQRRGAAAPRCEAPAFVCVAARRKFSSRIFAQRSGFLVATPLFK